MAAARTISVNTSWTSTDFLTAAEQYYRGRLHCTGGLRRLCIVSVMSGRQISPAFAVAATSNRNLYASMHGFTACHTKFAAPNGRDPGWSKYLVVAALLRSCGVVMWMDADAVFSGAQSMEPLLALIDQGREVLVAGGLNSRCRLPSDAFEIDHAYWQDVRRSDASQLGPTNNGVFLMRSGHFAAAALQALYGPPRGSTERKWLKANSIGVTADNQAMNNWLRKLASSPSPFAQHLRSLIGFVDRRAFNCGPSQFTRRFAGGCRVLHAPGVTFNGGSRSTYYRTKYDLLQHLLMRCATRWLGLGGNASARAASIGGRLLSTLGEECRRQVCRFSHYGCREPSCGTVSR